MYFLKLTLLSIIFTTLSVTLSGCKKIKSVNGQYLGTILQNEQEKNIAVFLSETTLTKKNFIEVSVNEIDASKNPINITLELINKHSLNFKINNNAYLLDIEEEDSCFVSSTPRASFRLCLDKNQITLDFNDYQNTQNSLKIFVKKSNDLTILKTKESYTVGELLGRAKFLNYTVEQRVQNVYRARQKITTAMGNLIPHISLGNVWEISSSNPLAFIGAIGNLMPFIFPSNWFEFKESKDIYHAELKAYASLRGNMINTVEGLTYLHLRNIEILKKMNNEIYLLNNLLLNIELMEKSGTAAQGSAERLSLKIGNLLLDKEQVEEFLMLENSEIAQAVSLSPLEKIHIDFTAFPQLEKVGIINTETCLASVTKKSFELESLDYMIKASDADISVRKFSFLDPSSGELNFGIPSNIRIGKLYREELKLKRKELLMLLQKRCSDSVIERNKTVRSYNLSNQYLKNATKMRDILIKKLLLDGNLSENILDDLSDNADNLLKFESQRISAAAQFIISEGKLNRLILEGVYANLGIGL